MHQTISLSIRRLLGAGVLALALGVAAAPAGTLAKGGDGVRVDGNCTGSSSSKLKVKAEDGGKLEVEWEVDQNKVGRTWNVRIKDNGQLRFSGQRVTKAPSGSFTVHRLITNLAGTDHVVARAKNPVSGEVCTASLSV
jgi:hypothetical protein